MKPEWVSAIATVAGVIVAAIYVFYTYQLWRETHRTAEAAQRQSTIAQWMLEAAHRPYLSIGMYEDAGTGSQILNMASVLHNHGSVPATVASAALRASWGGGSPAQGEQLQPNQIPSQLCIFPGQTGELTWGISDVSFAPWPVDGFLRIHVEVTYRGAFNQTYATRLEVSHSRPHTLVGTRATLPMTIVRAEAT